MQVHARRLITAATSLCLVLSISSVTQADTSDAASNVPPPPPPPGMGTLQPKNIPAPPPPFVRPGSGFSAAPFQQTLERSQSVMNRAIPMSAPDIAALERNQVQLRGQLQELVKQQSQLLNLLDKQTQQQKRTVEQNEKLREQLSTLQAERNNWKSEGGKLNLLNDNVADLTARIAQEQQRVASMKGQLGQLNELKTQVETLTTERDQLVTSLNQAKSGLEFSDSELSETKTRLQTLEAENSELIDQLSGLNMEFDTARASLIANESDLKLIPQLQDTLTATSDELEALREQFGQQSQANESLRRELETAQSQLGAAATDAQSMEELRDQLTLLTEENQSLKTQINEHSARYTKAQTALETAQSSAGQVTTLEEQIQTLTTQLTSSQTETGDLKTALEDAQARLAASGAMEAEFTDAKATLTEQVQQLEALNLTKTDLESQLVIAAEENHALASEIEALKTANEKLGTDLGAFKETLTTKESDLQRLTEESETLTLASNERISGFEKQLDELQSSLNATRQERDKFRLAAQDSDKDGISDLDDQCPETAKDQKVGADGCEPDTDKDGVADRLDLCPNSPAGGKPDEMGCQPEENVALEGVTFEPGTDQLTGSSLGTLDKIADVLERHKKLKLEIAGHTDHTGPEGFNMALSSARAEAVKVYLTSKGINEERLKAKGYGPSMPVADNDTREGRAKNRRVELRRQ